MSPSNLALVVLAVALVVVSFIALKANRNDTTQAHMTPEELRRQVADATRESLVAAQQMLTETTQAQLQTATTSVEAQNRAASVTLNEIINPLRETLKTLDAKVNDLEKNRTEAYTRLNEQVINTNTVLNALRSETTTLSGALRRSDTRGRWGELQLIKLIEMIGMSEHVSFVEQKQQVGEGIGKPDVTVQLPGDRVLYIDSKAPIDTYLSAVAETDAKRREELMKQHANVLLGHVKALESRKYVEDAQAMNYVVMFVPTESSLADACQAMPELIEEAAKRNVALTSPTSLIAVLSNIARLWQAEKQVENAAEMAKASQELHSRLKVFIKHVSGVGESLEKAVKTYNSAIGSFEDRVMPSARRVEALGDFRDPIDPVDPIELLPRTTRYSDDTNELNG